MIRRVLLVALVWVALPSSLSSQIAVVQRNVNLRADPSSQHEPLRLLEPPEVVALLDTTKVSGYLRVRTDDGLEGWVWSRNVQVDLTQGFVTDPPDVAEPYDRDEWDHWIDEDSDCQDTRQEVLVRDADQAVIFQNANQCRVASSEWIDPYRNRTFTNPSDLDVDHMVPLKNAHLSGGWRWDSNKKRDYANSLADSHHLLAVHDSLNQAKGAKGPEEWMPPDTTYWCTYIADWVRIKNEWELTMTPAEKATVDSIGATCP